MSQLDSGARRNVLKLPLNLNFDTVFEDAIPILQQVRPKWFSSPSEKGKGEGEQEDKNDYQVQMKVFSGGITNKLVGFFIEKDVDDIVIVKLYGEKTDMLIDREKEVKTMKLLHDKKCGPELYAIFENGIAYEYSPGETLDVVSCRMEKVYSLVAKEMAKMHSLIPLESSDTNNGIVGMKSGIWKMLRNFYNLIVEAFEINPKLKTKLEDLGISESWCNSQIEELENLCNIENMPITFCHNDLLLGNIVYDESKAKVSFIDFEYAAPNYPPFDIANHFNEFAGVDDADFSRCPDDEFMRMWISHYVAASTLDLDVDLVFRWVQLCMPLSHLMWILWSIYQACYSTIDFDFINYISLRLPEYKKGMELIQSQRNSP